MLGEYLLDVGVIRLNSLKDEYIVFINRQGLVSVSSAEREVKYRAMHLIRVEYLLGDVLVEPSGDEFVLIEDYREEAEQWLNNNKE